MTSIDNSDLGRVTADGDEITEITADGDSVFQRYADGIRMRNTPGEYTFDVTPFEGTYRFELWGAGGADGEDGKDGESGYNFGGDGGSGGTGGTGYPGGYVEVEYDLTDVETLSFVVPSTGSLNNNGTHTGVGYDQSPTSGERGDFGKPGEESAGDGGRGGDGGDGGGSGGASIIEADGNTVAIAHGGGGGYGGGGGGGGKGGNDTETTVDGVNFYDGGVGGDGGDGGLGAPPTQSTREPSAALGGDGGDIDSIDGEPGEIGPSLSEGFYETPNGTEIVGSNGGGADGDGKVVLFKDVPTSVSRNNDNGMQPVGGDHGIRFKSTERLANITAELSSGSDHVSQGVLIDVSSGSTVSTTRTFDPKKSSGDTFTVPGPIEPGKEYAVAVNNGGNSHDAGVETVPSTPYTSSDGTLIITGGWEGSNNSVVETYSIKKIGDTDAF